MLNHASTGLSALWPNRNHFTPNHSRFDFESFSEDPSVRWALKLKIETSIVWSHSAHIRSTTLECASCDAFIGLNSGTRTHNGFLFCTFVRSHSMDFSMKMWQDNGKYRGVRGTHSHICQDNCVFNGFHSFFHSFFFLFSSPLFAPFNQNGFRFWMRIVFSSLSLSVSAKGDAKGFGSSFEITAAIFLERCTQWECELSTFHLACSVQPKTSSTLPSDSTDFNCSLYLRRVLLLEIKKKKKNCGIQQRRRRRRKKRSLFRRYNKIIIKKTTNSNGMQRRERMCLPVPVRCACAFTYYHFYMRDSEQRNSRKTKNAQEEKKKKKIAKTAVFVSGYIDQFDGINYWIFTSGKLPWQSSCIYRYYMWWTNDERWTTVWHFTMKMIGFRGTLVPIQNMVHFVIIGNF